MATAAFCWGTFLGSSLFGFAMLCHLFSVVDALRQWSFPVFPRRIALSATFVGMGVILYLPAMVLLWLCALPTQADRLSGAGYLVNRLAYQQKEPSPGQWIWLRSAPSRTPLAGRIVAVAGQEVECIGRRWRVDGGEVQLPYPGPPTDYPDGWRFRVPKDHVLVGTETRGAKTEVPSPLIIVARDQIVGRAWARYYPLWDRSLL
jgi:hypothetical protein